MSDAERLQRLEDAEAIRNLIASYGPLADAGESQAVAEIWAEDGEYDIGGFSVARGREAVAGAIDSEVHRGLMAGGCAHVLTPHHIALDGDRATATGYSIVYREQGDSFEAWRVSANRWELARQADGAWRATRRVNRLLDGDADAREILGTIA